ncbi:Hemicentin-1 [Desmophyllum pertusum]|uniref:Hemicentin-1 n=1 Tax=Desmophyllum pertusum TaxID=174260 RepID=A0A9X0CVW4_9CNID|nr:Hemicentin-1 [Desmophyllum pertusum]
MPPTIKDYTGETTITEGMEKVLKCEAKGAPKPNAAWYRNGKELNTTDCHVTPNDKSCDDVIYEVYEDNPSSSLHSTFNTQVLKIRSALYPRDQGKFECIATNGQLPNDNLVIDLDVQAAPVIHKVTQPVVVRSDLETEVICVLEKANPLPKFTWKYQNENFPANNNPCQTHESIWITVPGYLMITPTDTPTNRSVVKIENDQTDAFYRCEAVNAVGNDSYVIKLVRLAEVKDWAEFDPKSKTQFNEKSTLRLVCFDRCGEFCNAHFRKGGKKLLPEDDARVNVTQLSRTEQKPENRVVLTIKNLTLNDSGNYRCVSSDLTAHIYDDINITINSVFPSYFELVPKKPIIVLQGQGGQISCEAEGYTVSKLTWKKRTNSGEVSVPDSMVTNVIDEADNLVKAILTITNARPEDGGDYQCVLTAFNKQYYKLTSVRVDECDKDFDLTFVIDGSGSIEQAGRGNFKRVKDFVKRLIAGFSVGFDETHVGAVVYSSASYVRDVFKLNDYYDIAGITRAIDDIIYPYGGTYTGKALRKVANCLYTSSDDRPDKSNVCIVITDGKSNDEIGGPASALRSRETTIFAIGVGTDPDRSELEIMAGNPSNVFTADFNELETVVEQIMQSACQVDGDWSEWSQWSLCTKTISGIQTRTRECSNPKPGNYGKPCSGYSAVVRECSNTSRCQEDFPLRFRAEKIPSLGTMEIFKNNHLEINFASQAGTKVNAIQTCMSMGYFENSGYDNGTWYKDSNASNTASHRNCSSLTNCLNKKVDKLQLCKAAQEMNLKLASCARTDGKIDCQDDIGAQALCEPLGDKKVLPRVKMVMDIGSKENFRCSLQNETSLIRWYNSAGQELNSVPGGRIRAFPDGTFAIQRVELSDGGTYQCRGLEYTQYYIIYVNARFTEKTPHQTLISGKPGVLNCSAEGAPAPWFTWSKTDGKALIKERFKLLPNGNMHVRFAITEDQGKYICTINQNKGTKRTTSKPQYIDVSVIVPPSGVQLLGANQTIREGDSVNLTCIIKKGLPKPDVFWYKNETRIIEEQSTNLILTKVTDKDEGSYKCEARNAGGVDDDIVNVTIDIPPKVNPLLTNQSVPLNSTFAIRCFVRGDPLPKVNWSKDGLDLRNNNNTLTINSMTFQDAGWYGCSAENWAGKIETYFWVDVTGKRLFLLNMTR